MTEKRHGKGLLFIVTLVLAAAVIKYADIPFAQTVREKAASALSGAAHRRPDRRTGWPDCPD